MVNLEYYKVFYHVAKLKSITLAAEELFISQPAVSQSIKQLESLLGGILFFRTPKGMRLTQEGELLYLYVSQGYELLMQGESKYKELFMLEAGEIRIGASDMTLKYYLLPYLEEFNKLYPKVKIKVTNAPTPETLEYLKMGKIDFGVVSAPVTYEKGISIFPVSKIQDVFVANKRFNELKNKVIKFNELATYPIICLEHNTSTRKYVDSVLQQNGMRLSPEFELATSELIVQFAAKSMGIGCVVRNFAEEKLQDKSLFEIKLKESLPDRDICIALFERSPVSQAGKRLLDMLKV